MRNGSEVFWVRIEVNNCQGVSRLDAVKASEFTVYSKTHLLTSENFRRQ